MKLSISEQAFKHKEKSLEPIIQIQLRLTLKKTTRWLVKEDNNNRIQGFQLDFLFS